LSPSPDDPDRVHRLDRRGLVLGVAALGFAVMLGGLLASPHPYGSVEFVVDFFVAELVLAAVLLGAPAAAFQFVFTMLAGAIFIQGAVGARSLWPAMVVHALYDAATFDLGRFAVAGAGSGPALALGGIALVLGVWSLVQFRSLAGAEPYAR